MERKECDWRSRGPGKVILNSWQDLSKPLSALPVNASGFICVMLSVTYWHERQEFQSPRVQAKKLKSYCPMNALIIHTETAYGPVCHTSVNRSLPPPVLSRMSFRLLLCSLSKMEVSLSPPTMPWPVLTQPPNKLLAEQQSPSFTNQENKIKKKMKNKNWMSQKNPESSVHHCKPPLLHIAHSTSCYSFVHGLAYQ